MYKNIYILQLEVIVKATENLQLVTKDYELLTDFCNSTLSAGLQQ
jgi:hypothetical protein